MQYADDDASKRLLPNNKALDIKFNSNDTDLTDKDQQQFTWFLACSVMVAVLGSFQFGWNLGVVNNPEKAISQCADPGDGFLPQGFMMSKFEWGTVVAIFSIGGLIGGLFGGTLCQRIGRRMTLAVNNATFLLGGLLMALSVNIPMLVCGRFLVGVGAGVATAAVPMYTSEIGPVRYRGAIGTMHQLAVVSGILISQLCGLALSEYTLWRYLLALTCVPAIVQLACVSFLVETPGYLISEGRIDEAEPALRKLRDRVDVSQELGVLVASHEKQVSISVGSSMSVWSLIKSTTHRRALILAIVAQLSQQLCGINGVIQYSTAIFQAIFGDLALTITVLVGVVNLLSTIVSVALVERAGRRPLFLSSQFGVAVVALCLTISSIYAVDILTACLVMLYVAFFAIGLGPIPWMIMGEIFNTNALGAASSIGVCVNWISSFAISLLFPIVMDGLETYTFLPFSGITLCFAVVIFFTLPETKGKSVEETSRQLR